MADKKIYQDKQERILDALNYCDPTCDDYADDNKDKNTYNPWIAVGMALYKEGFPSYHWIEWSRRDPGAPSDEELERKYNSFKSNCTFGSGGDEGVIYKYAKKSGWEWRPTRDETDTQKNQNQGGVLPAPEPPRPAKPKTVEELVLETITPIEVQPLKLPDPMGEPVEQLELYLKTLFKPDDLIAWTRHAIYKENRGKWEPIDDGRTDVTAGMMIKSLQEHPDDIRRSIGQCNPVSGVAGSWIHMNPHNGGFKKTDVADFRYALVESDLMTMEEQYAYYVALNLPIVALVTSGKRSLHAVVRIDAADAKEYHDRVVFLYSYLEKTGFDIDSAPKNSNRMSRMPGTIRDGNMQNLLAVNIGAESYEAWREPIEERGKRPDNTLDYLREHYFDDIKKFREGGRSTGFPIFDKLTTGLHEGLFMVAAGPGTGKTTFCYQIADFIASRGDTEVLYFSLEQVKRDFMVKSIARRIKQEHPTTKFTNEVIRDGSENGSEEKPIRAAIEQVCRENGNRLSVIEGNFGLSAEDVREKTETYIKATGTRPVVVVDYLQALRPLDDSKDTRAAIERTVDVLCTMKNEYKLCMIVVSSINRQSYYIPLDIDGMKESGRLEFSADAVWCLECRMVREESFLKKDILARRLAIEDEKNKTSSPRRMAVTVVKSRFCAPGTRAGFNYYAAHDMFEEVELPKKKPKNNGDEKEATQKMMQEELTKWQSVTNCDEIPFT